MSLKFSQRQIRFSWSILMAVMLLLGGVVGADALHLNLVQVQDTINPGVEDFLRYAIERSEEEGAECLIIHLDTPGGLMTSTRGIVQAILNSEVPVVVYVSPSGAQAASAGVFVTVAADIAAMAPGTNIGPAQETGRLGNHAQRNHPNLAHGRCRTADHPPRVAAPGSAEHQQSQYCLYSINDRPRRALF